MTLAPWMAALLLGLSPVPQDPEEGESKKCPFRQDSPEIERLVEDLGAEGAETRQKASRRLTELGEAALPLLKTASQDADAERAMAAREVLLAIDRRLRSDKGDREERRPPPLMAVVYYDWGRGVFFQTEPSGKVELTLPVKNGGGRREFRRYRADSFEQLRRDHPEAAGQVELSGKAPPQGAREWWARTEKWLSLEPENEDDSELESRDGRTDAEHVEAWRARHREMLEDFLKTWKDQVADEERPSLGALVGSVEPPIRSQLGLQDGEGVLVLEVREDTVAEKSGLKKHDVIVRVAGESVREVRDFHREVGRALKGGRFALEVRRAGECRKLEVDPGSSK